MTNVHELPDSMQRAWRVFAEGISHALHQAHGVTEAEIEHALAALKPLYLRAAQPNPIAFDPTDPEAAVRGVNEWIYQVTHMLLLAIAVREVQLFRMGK